MELVYVVLVAVLFVAVVFFGMSLCHFFLLLLFELRMEKSQQQQQEKRISVNGVSSSSASQVLANASQHFGQVKCFGNAIC